MQCTSSCLPNLILKLVPFSLSYSTAFPTCWCEKAIYLVVNVTGGHILLRAELRYLERSSLANVHLLAFPDVPLCLHIRTAVTETLPAMVDHRNEAEAERSRGNQPLESCVGVSPSDQTALKNPNPLLDKTRGLLTHLKLLMCPGQQWLVWSEAWESFKY